MVRAQRQLESGFPKWSYITSTPLLLRVIEGAANYLKRPEVADLPRSTLLSLAKSGHDGKRGVMPPRSYVDCLVKLRSLV